MSLAPSKSTRATKAACAQDGCVWITGASSGIGMELAKLYSAQGWRVAVSARNEEELNKLAEQLPNCAAFPCDVTKAKNVNETITAIESDFAPIALAILNAGIYLPTAIPHFDAKSFKRTFDVNVGGVINCLDALIPLMLERNFGQIASVASVAGFNGLPTSAAYGATKAALLNMSESLAIEYAPYNLYFSVIAPGFVETPLTDKNRFSMPFILTVNDASQRIIDGLSKGTFLIAFPKRFVFILRMLQLIPRNIYVSLMRFFLKRK